MSELDDRLKDLVYILRGEGASLATPTSRRIGKVASVEERVAEIKQAFADAGYIQIPVVTEQINDDRSTHLEVRGVQVMTGKEWYERFVKELNRRTQYPTIQLQLAEAAARKASGIDKNTNIV